MWHNILKRLSEKGRFCIHAYTVDLPPSVQLTRNNFTSWQIAFMSAPLILSGRATSINNSMSRNKHTLFINYDSEGVHFKIQSSKSTSSERFILAVMVEKMSLFWRRSGIGNSILRSNLPGLRRAGSSVSCRLVAIITCMHMQTNSTFCYNNRKLHNFQQ